MDDNFNNNSERHDNKDINNNEEGFSGEYHYRYPEKNRYDYKNNYMIENEDKNFLKHDDIDLIIDKPLNNKKDLVTMSKGLKTFLISAVIVLLLLLALVVGYFIYYINNGDGRSINIPGITSQNSLSETQNATQNPNNVSINLEKPPTDSNEMTAGQVYEKVAQSVVGIVVYDSSADVFSDPIGQASGVIISEDGYIVTNSHVVGDSKQYGIKIVLSNMEEVSGKIVGIDKKTDLAVVKADKAGLTPASFADSDQVKVGDSVLAIGNPGTGDVTFYSSLTKGIVSALNRSLGGSQKLVKYIQTDTAINSGNSGGGLFNMYGQVIGINTLKLNSSYYEGMGFAIPSNTVKSIIDSIIANGYVSGRVILGISGKMVSAYQAQIYNVPMGAIVSKISSESDLKNKGVKTGDIIIKINDINITGVDVLSEELSKHKVGDTVKLTIYRPSSDRSNYSTFDAHVKLIEDKGESETETNNTRLK